MYPIEPDENDSCLNLDWDGIFTEETFGDRLRLFYNQFNSSVRALLDDVLFREIKDQDVVIGLEILCPNPIIYKRLVQKKQKISNEIRWIWPETVIEFKVGIQNPEWVGTTFHLPDYWLK